jgi:hypothetical protein
MTVFSCPVIYEQQAYCFGPCNSAFASKYLCVLYSPILRHFRLCLPWRLPLVWLEQLPLHERFCSCCPKTVCLDSIELKDNKSVIIRTVHWPFQLCYVSVKTGPLEQET